MSVVKCTCTQGKYLYSCDFRRFFEYEYSLNEDGEEIPTKMIDVYVYEPGSLVSHFTPHFGYTVTNPFANVAMSNPNTIS
jgi:hypothetical protein